MNFLKENVKSVIHLGNLNAEFFPWTSLQCVMQCFALVFQKTMQHKKSASGVSFSIISIVNCIFCL